MRKETNKELILEYPWLDVGDDMCTLLDTLPDGWHDLVLEMCHKLKYKLIGYDLFDKYRVAEAKEKWNMLRWYDYIDDDAQAVPQDIVDLVSEYEEKSRGVCMICGASKSINKDVCNRCKYSCMV